jgi:hypothetical protein
MIDRIPGGTVSAWNHSPSTRHATSRTGSTEAQQRHRPAVLTGPRRCGKPVALLDAAVTLCGRDDVDPRQVIHLPCDGMHDRDLHRRLTLGRELTRSIDTERPWLCVWLLDEVSSVKPMSLRDFLAATRPGLALPYPVHPAALQAPMNATTLASIAFDIDAYDQAWQGYLTCGGSPVPSPSTLGPGRCLRPISTTLPPATRAAPDSLPSTPPGPPAADHPFVHAQQLPILPHIPDLRSATGGYSAHPARRSWATRLPVLGPQPRCCPLAPV